MLASWSALVGDRTVEFVDTTVSTKAPYAGTPCVAVGDSDVADYDAIFDYAKAMHGEKCMVVHHGVILTDAGCRTVGGHAVESGSQTETSGDILDLATFQTLVESYKFTQTHVQELLAMNEKLKLKVAGLERAEGNSNTPAKLSPLSQRGMVQQRKSHKRCVQYA